MFSFNPLFHTLLDARMSGAALCKKTGISSATLAKLKHGKNVTTDVLDKICSALGCDLSAVAVHVPNRGGGKCENNRGDKL